MKGFAKILALILACLLLITMFVACGGETETESKDVGKETNAPSVTPGGETETDPRNVADDVPDDLRFDGETVTFFTRNDLEHWKYEMDVDEIMNDTLYDAIYYRNKTVEEQLGITITTLQQPGNYANRSTWNDTLRTAVNTQTGDFDAAAIYLSQGSPLALENMYYNVIDFPHINLEKPWWNQNIQDELTLFGTLYYLAGDIAVTEMTETFTLMYNKNLYDKYFGNTGVSLYDVVEDKKWTIDYMYSLVENVHEDLNGDGLVSDGDIVGFAAYDPAQQDSFNDGWIAACGINITTMVYGVPELSFYSERTVRAYETLKGLLVTCPGTLAMAGPQVTLFQDGMLLFARGNLNSGAGLREMKDAYGMLPLPMLEENQEGGYATTVGNVASLITILSSVPDNRKELVGATLELMAAESYRQVTPAYFEIALKTKYSESPEDAEMYDLILKTVRFSFGYCYSTESIKGGGNQNPIGTLFRVMTHDLAAIYDENDEAYYENLQKLIEGLDEAAFKAMQ